MSLLGPIGMGMWAYVALGAAALAIGAYIIKMRRRRFEVPFSQLWRRVLDQKDANALWKQLKRLISLVFILGILGLILVAALDPTLGAVDRKARSVVVLLDASASMKTVDEGADKGNTGDEPRIDAAKARAKRLVDSMGGGDVAMIMRVDGRATPMSRFTSDGPMLDKVIDSIAASDTAADFPRALGAAADALRDRPNPLVVIISDGATPATQFGDVVWDKNAAPKLDAKGKPLPANLAAIDLSNIDVRFVGVGKRSDNVGIIAFNVRRYIADKAAYEAFIEVRNFGQEPAHRQLTLYNGETAVDTRKLDLGPGEVMRQIYPKIPGGETGNLRAVLRPVEGRGGSDAFALDDTAYALLPARKRQKVLMVTQDNLFLEGALLVYDNIESFKVSPTEYAAKPSYADGMDVVVFDDYTPDVLPPGVNLILFHPTGPNSPIAIRAGGDAQNPHITELDTGHPVMRWVSMGDVFMDRSEVFAPDPKRGETTLAYSVTDPVIAAKREGKRKIVAFGFSLPSEGRDAATDLPMRVAFPMLLVNALDWFAGDQADLLTTYRTGERVRVPLDGAGDATEAMIVGPDTNIQTPVIDGLATFYATRVGYYDVVVNGPGGATSPPIASIALAANLASPTESDIAPSATLTLGGRELQAPEAFAITHSQKLWIYLVLLALGLITLEWVTYHRRITV